MDDAEAVMERLPRRDGVSYRALVPNRKGLERAIAAGADVLLEPVGNLVTEAVVHTYAPLGIDTGLDPGAIAAAARDVSAILDIPQTDLPSVDDVRALIPERSPSP